MKNFGVEKEYQMDSKTRYNKYEQVVAVRKKADIGLQLKPENKDEF